MSHEAPVPSLGWGESRITVEFGSEHDGPWQSYPRPAALGRG
jgi:hypothetical protein